MTVQTPLRVSLAAEFPDGSNHFACPSCHNVHSISAVDAEIKPKGSRIWCPSCVMPLNIWVAGGRVGELNTQGVEGGRVLTTIRESDGRMIAAEQW